jgi:hypothetical protein
MLALKQDDYDNILKPNKPQKETLQGIFTLIATDSARPALGAWDGQWGRVKQQYTLTQGWPTQPRVGLHNHKVA